MKDGVEQLAVIAAPSDRLDEVVSRMAAGSTRYFGLALVVESDGQLVGLLNDGDVLRVLARGGDLRRPVSDVMTRDPITVGAGSSDQQVLTHVRARVWERTGGTRDLVKYVPVVDGNGQVVDVLDVVRLLSRSRPHGEHVEIHGLGFVGLTLAVALASRGHVVRGIDTNDVLVAQLQRGRPQVFEPRLTEMLGQALESKALSIATEVSSSTTRVVIVAVGTPVDAHGQVDDGALRAVAGSVGSRLRHGTLMLLRSTIPVGTTRQLVVPLLESSSGLRAGRDFHVAFTPERTVEGQAMRELASLPQIVGGLTDACADLAGRFWLTLTDSVVHVDSLEAAELVKLANNSFRDLSFAFANGLALLADRYNIDANRLVAAANEGYPRNPVPRPSPGVGGYCLTKDPHLYASVDATAGHALLSTTGRRVNAQAAAYPIEVVSRFARRTGRQIHELKVLLVGVAFKGWPATNDLRHSAALEVLAGLEQHSCEVRTYDAVVDAAAIDNLGARPTDLLEGADWADAILVLNNHPDNIPEGLLSRLSDREVLLFDGWGMMDRHEVEEYPNITYATLGYMTPATGS